MENDAAYWIENLNLIPHPEGGHYTETFKSQIYFSESEVANCTVNKNCASLIYFLLNKGECSAFHRLKSDEIWLYHSGASVIIYMIDDNGILTKEILGPEITDNENLQVFVPANTWFAAEIPDNGSYSLMSCLVTPGFEWNDFELGEKEILINQFPEHKDLLEKLCK